MSADIALATVPVPASSFRNPLETARLKLVKDFLSLKMPAYPSFPSPDDHESFAGVIREAAAIFDEWLAAVGHQVRDNATTGVSSNLFNGSFSGAIEGNETWACEEAGIEVRWNRTARRA